jgi:hypothetical protein
MLGMADDRVIIALQPAWRRQLVALIDEAAAIATRLRHDARRPEPNLAMLDRTLFVLAQLRAKTLNCHLPPPNGQTTLGIARGVLDWIEDLASPLAKAAGALERHYLTIPDEDPRFPNLAEFTVVARFADGSTLPLVSDGQAFIIIQDKAVFTIGIWRYGDFGGHIEPPVNEAALLGEAHARVLVRVPDVLDEVSSTSLTCPPDLVARMVWPEDLVP